MCLGIDGEGEAFDAPGFGEGVTGVEDGFVLDGRQGDAGDDARSLQVFDGALDGEVDAFGGSRCPKDLVGGGSDEGGDLLGGGVDGGLGAIAPGMVGAAGVAKLADHHVVDAIGNSWIDWGGGVVVEINHGGC